ncbi:MAG: hypothetical protein K6U74_10735, partial [Firmicutes bacterium]|nr:hypothetical protein [Bacillota bacterium]
MLTMAQIQNIRFLKNHKDMSLRSIAKETHHHVETVKKYVKIEDFNLQLREKQDRKGKLDPFKQLIDQWLTDDLLAKPKQRHTAKRIYDRLREQYGDKFNVSDRSVRAYVSKRRPEIFQSTDRGHIPLVRPRRISEQPNLLSEAHCMTVSTWPSPSPTVTVATPN